VKPFALLSIETSLITLVFFESPVLNFFMTPLYLQFTCQSIVYLNICK
jgi:hypothetical protein